MLIYPVYAIMIEDAGMSPTQLASLLVIWSATTLLFEVPSGVLGDLFQKKWVIAWSCVFDMLAFVVWLIWPTFWGFALGFTIWSFASALSSGTSEAYLHDVLEDKSSYEKIYGRTEAAESIGIATALLLGGFVATFGYELTLYLSMLAPLTGLLILVFCLPRSTVRPNAEDADSFGDAIETFLRTLISGAEAVARNRRIGLIIGISATLGAVAGVYEEYIGVLMREIGLGLTLVGVIYGAVWFSRTIGALLAHRLPNTLVTPTTLYAVAGTLLAISFSLEAAVPILSIALCAYYVVNGIGDVAFGARLQAELDDHHRATATSFQSMGLELLAVGAFFGLGFLAANSSWLGAMTIGAWLAALAAALWLLTLRVAHRLSGQNRTEP